MQEKRDASLMLLQGRRYQAVIITQEDHIILSALQPDTIAKRFSQKRCISGTRLRLKEAVMNKKALFIGFSGWKRTVFFPITIITHFPFRNNTKTT